MDFKLSEDQLMLQRMVREFAENDIKPRSLELDVKTDPMECVPWDLIKKASMLGLRTAFLPEEYGGGGLDQLSRMIMIEELSRGDSGFALLMLETCLMYETFVTLDRKEVVDEFIDKMLEDDTFLYGFATTEPDHGSDFNILYDAPETMKTFAEKKGDEYILNGRKLWTTNGGIAKLYYVSARTRRGLLSESMSTFLVPADTPGFSIGKISDKMGLRLETNAELIFEDVHIPARYLIGEENKGWRDREVGLGIVVNYPCAMLLGVLQAIYEVTLDYARNRIQGGKPIIEHPTIGVMLSEMRAQIEAGRLLVYKNAWGIDNQQYDPKMGWAAKGYLSGIAVPIAANAMEIHGAVGHEKGMYIEKYLRDVYSQLHALGLRTIAFLKARPTL